MFFLDRPCGGRSGRRGQGGQGIVEPRVDVEVVEGVPTAASLSDFKVCVAAVVA
jgi:hypothetical protein